MIREQQMELLKQYKEKAFVNSLLCGQSHNYHVFIKISLNNPEVKDLVGTRSKKDTKEIIESEKKTRSQTAASQPNSRSRNK